MLTLPLPPTMPKPKSTNHARNGLKAKVVDDQYADAAVQPPVSTVEPDSHGVLNASETAGLTNR